jgi:MoaA/NifB/PqqE/SkfB family radical SAM enzyme
MRFINHPVLCNYYVTYRCNASCSFCDIWERPSPYVTLGQAEENLKALRQLGVRVVDFTGGEPLLHRQIDQLLAMAQTEGFITTLTTNALLYPKWASRLRGKVDMLHFSLDSVHGPVHDASRGVACYDKLHESIELALSLGELPDILFTVTDENVGELTQAHDRYVKKYGLVLILNPLFGYNGVGGGLSSDTLAELEKWGNAPGVFLNRAFIALRRDGGNQIAAPVCKAGSTTIVLSPENELVIPCYHLGAHTHKIDERGLAAVWKSESVQHQIQQEGRLPACQGCAINCYMQPSFSVALNKYFFYALPSTLKYNYLKGTWKGLFRKRRRSSVPNGEVERTALEAPTGIAL